jgi:hypothetical protein
VLYLPQLASRNTATEKQKTQHKAKNAAERAVRAERKKQQQKEKQSNSR